MDQIFPRRSLNQISGHSDMKINLNLARIKYQENLDIRIN